MQETGHSVSQAPLPSKSSSSWAETIAGLIAILDEAAQPGRIAVWRAGGAKAFSEVLRQMAHSLDVVAPAALEAQRKISEELLERNQRLCAIGLDAVRLARSRETECSQLRDMITALGGDPDEIARTEDQQSTAPDVAKSGAGAEISGT